MRLIDADAIEYDFNIKTYSENRIIVTKLLADKDTIDAVPTVNQWISVKDCLPEESGDYLVWALFACEEYPTYSIVHYDADFEAFGEWDDIFDPHTFRFLDSEFEEIKGVIARMPLPEPYKNKEGETHDQ